MGKVGEENMEEGAEERKRRNLKVTPGISLASEMWFVL